MSYLDGFMVARDQLPGSTASPPVVPTPQTGSGVSYWLKPRRVTFREQHGLLHLIKEWLQLKQDG